MAKIIHFPPPRPGRHQSSIFDLQSSNPARYNNPSVSTELETVVQEGRPFLVGEWLVEPKLNRVSRGEVTVQLELKAMDVLLCLVDHAGDLVSKHDLLDTVWQTEFVSDNTVVNRIAELRGAFGDDPQNPRYIETIRKRGYRLIAEVGPVTMAAEASRPEPDIRAPVENKPNPYPGLAAFTESDADRFFGREAESAALWRKISSRRLLAVIGPSGVGKSSLLRAGVAARAPPGWRVVVFTPAENPTLSLARALASDHAGDPAAMARLLGFSDADTALAVVAQWRGQFSDAVLVVDQFEELFTLNPPEVQVGFIALLRRLVDAADVHVVLGLRDDFLHYCQSHPPISPIFESLTPLGPPDAAGLRRALKEPAARRQVGFETEVLVDRMIGEVAGERGALPLLAFAIQRLWEERDRDRRVLTEEAYDRIGGVAGALAQHAEQTLERIGFEKLPIVREVFRNLVTSEATRAVREWDEILSVFRDSRSESRAEEVLRTLIDSRLLTSYELREGDEAPTRRVEIVHESLLTSWPRLVRWQTQDADSARLRDELRQAARLWDDHERARDYLWTGNAFREFAVWQANYPGGLTDLEEAFAAAMTSLATRRRRRRRMAAAAVFGVLLAVLVVVGALWQRSVRETRRAEAAKLLALGQLRLEDYPTATLAHAIASLELADTPEARRLALRALWEGPTAFVINQDASYSCEFTPDGGWLVQSMQREFEPQVGVVASDGTRTDFDQDFGIQFVSTIVNPEGTVVFSKPELASASPQRVVLWSIPHGRKLCDVQIPPPARATKVVGWNRDRCLALVWEDDRPTIHAFNFDGTHERLGTLDLSGYRPVAIDLRTGRLCASVEDGAVSVCRIGEHELAQPRFLGRHEGTAHQLAVDPEGRFVATSSFDGQIRIWDPSTTSPPVVLRGPEGILKVGFFGGEPMLAVRTEENGARRIWVYSFSDGHGRLLRTIDVGQAGDPGLTQPWGWDLRGRLFARNCADQTTRLWSLAAPADSGPLALRRGDVAIDWHHSFHPEGRWLATADVSGLMVWPLSRMYPSVIRSHQKSVWSVAFARSGQWLASGCSDGVVWITPLKGEVPAAGQVLGQTRGSSAIRFLAPSPDGSRILAARDIRGAAVIPLDGTQESPVGNRLTAYGAAYSAEGRLVGVTGRTADNRFVLDVFATDTLERVNSFEPLGRGAFVAPRFLSDGRIAYADESGLAIADPKDGTSELVLEGTCLTFAISGDEKRIAFIDLAYFSWSAPGSAILLDLEAGTAAHLASHGDQVSAIATDAAGTVVVTGDKEGVLRVGSAGGEEPHLLLGHKGRIWSVDTDPLGQWIATGGDDGTVRIWPMPDLSKPPLHTLPHDELIAKLKTLTNLRVVRDEEDPTGWTLTHDPFPGWATVPTW